MKRFLTIAIVLAASALWPALSGAATFKGVVVGSQHGTLLVAGAGGGVNAVGGRASVGSRVAVSGRTVHVVGHANRAVVRGVVVGRTATTMFLSAGRHLLAVHVARHTASVGSTPVPLVPLPGHAVSTTLHISNGGQLDDEGDDDLGPAPAVSVDATIAAVAAGSVTLTVNGQTLMLPLPAGLTLPATLVGTTVTLQLSFPGGQPQVSGGNQGDDQGDDDGGDGGGDG
jgi:hypothetical protein